MIKLTVVLLFGVAWGGRLENTYLPPGGAKIAGGNGNILEAPISNVVGNGGFDDGFNGRKFGSINNGGFRSNGVNKLSPVISIDEGPSGNGNGPSPVYGAPLQNGIHFGGGGRSVAPVNILRYNNENDGTGIYKFEYETENHISQQERGDLKNVGGDASSVVEGSYSYAGPDGHTYTVNYIADENGFQPTGEHIHIAVQAAAADAARNAAAEGRVGGYPTVGQPSNEGYRY